MNYFWGFLYPSPKNLDFMRVTAICTVSQKHHFQKPLCPDATLFILQWAKISILHTSPFPSSYHPIPLAAFRNGIWSENCFKPRIYAAFRTGWWNGIRTGAPAFHQISDSVFAS